MSGQFAYRGWGANGDRLNWPRLLAYGADSARLFRAYLAVTAWLGRSAKRGHPITRQIAAPVHGPDGKLARRRKGGAVHVHASQDAAGNLGGLAVPILRGGQRAQAVGGRHGRIILVADNQGRPAATLEQSVAQVLLDGARMDRDGMEAWMDRWRESLWAQALARVRAGERPLFTAEEEEAQTGHVQQHMSGSSDLVDDMVAGVAAAIDADHAAGAHGISLRKTLMQVGGGDEQTVKSNERRVTALLRDSGYISKRARWEGSGPSNRWFRAVCRHVPTFPIVTMKNSGVVDSPPTAINNDSSIDGYNGEPRHSRHSRHRSTKPRIWPVSMN